MIPEVKKFVNSLAPAASIRHFNRTEYWVRQLKPTADIAMLIAAYAHDIERYFDKTSRAPHEWLDEKYLEHHQKRSGKIMYDFLMSKGVDEKIAERVRSLIALHEVGGNPDADIIKDADSLSYFENNAARHFEWIRTQGLSKSDIKKKYDWMFNRISSRKAREMAKNNYKKMVEMISS